MRAAARATVRALTVERATPPLWFGLDDRRGIELSPVIVRFMGHSINSVGTEDTRGRADVSQAGVGRAGASSRPDTN
jgi:hypothetical protein